MFVHFALHCFTFNVDGISLYQIWCIIILCSTCTLYAYETMCIFLLSIFHLSFFISQLFIFIYQHVIYHLSEVHLSYVVYRMSSSYHPFMKYHICHTMFPVSKCAMPIYWLSCITMSISGLSALILQFSSFIMSQLQIPRVIKQISVIHYQLVSFPTSTLLLCGMRLPAFIWTIIICRISYIRFPPITMSGNQQILFRGVNCQGTTFPQIKCKESMCRVAANQ